MAGNAKEITDAEFEQEVLKSETPVLVDFWAPWCGPCLMMAPVLEEIAGELSDKLKVCKVNVDKSQEHAGKYGVMAIPTLILFKDGDMAKRLEGFRPKEALVSEIESAL